MMPPPLADSDSDAAGEGTAGRLLFLLADAPFFISHRLPIACAAKAAGFEVHVAVPFAAEPVRRMRACGLVHHDIPLRRGARSLWGELHLIAAFARLIRRLRPEMVHAVSLKPVIYGGLMARLVGVPAAVLAVTGLGYVFLRKGVGATLTRALVRRLYRFALAHPNGRAVFQNPDDRDLFVDGGLVAERRVVMIRGCGVDTAVFAPAPEPDGTAMVVFPARILGDKGAHEFVAAARRLRGDGVAARFVMVGRTDPDNPTDIGEPAIRRWEAEGAVEWWGFRDDMAAVLSQAHIVCMPSYREGLPRVLIEAAACGRPIVTADVPGCREIVRDSENGLLVPVRDGAATAAAIRRLLDEPGLRRRLGARGRKIVLAEFSVERFVAETLAVYAELSAPAEQSAARP